MYLLKRGDRFNYALLFALVLLLIIMLAFARFQVGMDTIFERGITTALLLISIIAGAGLYWLRTKLLSIRLSDKYKPRRFAYAGGVFCTLSVVVILSVALPARFNVPYYHMIDDEDYRAFVWIRDNIGPEYETALVDPWKATAFVAVSGKNVIRRIWMQKEPADEILEKYLNGGCQETASLAYDGLSLLYNTTQCQNSDLFKINAGMYIIKQALQGTPTPRKDTLQTGWTFESKLSTPTAWLTSSGYCDATFLYPQAGRNGGTSIGINVVKTVPGFKPWPHASWSQYTNVTAGKKYRISGWISTENITGNGGAVLVTYWFGPGYKWIPRPLL